MCYIYHQLKYASPNRSKNKTRATQKSLPSGKKEVWGKQVRRMGENKKDKRERVATREEIWEEQQEQQEEEQEVEQE